MSITPEVDCVHQSIKCLQLRIFVCFCVANVAEDDTTSYHILLILSRAYAALKHLLRLLEQCVPFRCMYLSSMGLSIDIHTYLRT